MQRANLEGKCLAFFGGARYMDVVDRLCTQNNTILGAVVSQVSRRWR